MGGVYWEPAEIGMAALGGSFIALATTLHLLLLGRITGMSGMFFTIIRLCKKEHLVAKISAVFGIVLIPFLFYFSDTKHLEIDGFSYRVLDDQTQANDDLSLAGWAVGGLLVGIGTKLGNGCTSGHGVCGLPRLSLRSFVAVGCFMATSVGISTLRFYEPFLDEPDNASDTLEKVYHHIAQAGMCLLFLIVLGLSIYRFITKTAPMEKYEPVISFLVGGVFGMGLLVSGMCRRTKIRDFLSLGDGWDPSLMFVLLAAVSINFLTFQLIIRNPKMPLLAKECELPKKKTIDWQVIVGPAIFGLGWGISGFCPGPGMVNLFLTPQCGVYIVALAVGQMLSYGLTLFIDHQKSKQTSPADSHKPQSPSADMNLQDKTTPNGLAS